MFPPDKNRSSFTLIELLVVLALVAILSVVVVLTLNPAELIKQARDSNRLSDLATINTALNLFSADVTSGFMGTSTVVYVSIPDSSPTCANLGLPTLPTSTVNYTYNCVTAANLRNTNGTGWIPVNFQRISSNSPISQLPVDPINTTSTGNYYTYITGGSWMLTAIPESAKQKAALITTPNIPNYPGVISMGNNAHINPLYNPSGLIGYWPLNGDTKDYSGNGNNGIWYGTSTQRYVVDKNWALAGYFNGSSDYLDLATSTALSGEFTIVFSINSNSYSARQEILTAVSPTTNYFELSAPTVFMLAQIGCGGVYNIDTGGMVAGKSYQVVVGRDGGNNLFLFNNGMQKSLLASSTCTYYIKLIGGSVGLGRWTSGMLSDIRIYNRALSAAEVSALYNATK